MALFCTVLFCGGLPLHAAESSKQNADATAHRFTLLVEPAHAKVEILNLKTPYQADMLLKPGRYHIAVSAPNHVTERGFVDVTDQDWIGKVVLLPMSPPSKGEENDDGVAARIEEEWQKIKREKDQLGKTRQNLDREKEKLELSFKELEQNKATLETQRKELETGRRELENARKELENKRASTPAADNKAGSDKAAGSDNKAQPEKALLTDKPLGEKPVRELRTELPPVPTPPPQVAPRNKANKEPPLDAPVPVPAPMPAPVESEANRATVASPGASEAATTVNPLTETATEEPATPLSAPAPSLPEESAAALTPTPPTVPPAPATPVATEEKASAPTAAPAVATATGGEDVNAVLHSAMRYLRLPRPPRSEAPPESEGILNKLQMAQKEHPGNQAIAQALQMHAKRYIVYTGLFESKEKADAMVKNIQTLGVPSFLQAMTVKNKPVLRVCIGPFLQQAEAEKSLQFLLNKVEILNPIMRIYKQ
ncbi:MAG: SPOR domain-containing protein [Magnetococcales bacterium]|nr:SPOR domain-containing protein [Magnetococcales bacterium]